MALIWRTEKNELAFDKDKFGIKIAALAASADTIDELWWLADVITSTVHAAMLDRSREMQGENNEV